MHLNMQILFVICTITYGDFFPKTKDGNEYWKNPEMSQLDSKVLLYDANGGLPDKVVSDSVVSDTKFIGTHLKKTSMWNNMDISTQNGTKKNYSSAITLSVSKFAYHIGKILGEKNSYSKSEVFSPLSAMSALLLILIGAKGKSYQELLNLFAQNTEDNIQNDPNTFHEKFASLIDRVLSLSSSNSENRLENAPWRNISKLSNIGVLPYNDQESHIIKIVNGLFIQDGYDFNLDYRHVVESIYHSNLMNVDFDGNNARSIDIINEWVSLKTLGKIPNIISEIPRSTKMIISNGVYFKGVWENQFFEKATVLDDFYPDGQNNPPIKVKMMATSGMFPSYEASEYDCRIIGLPYKGNETTMYIIQPNESNRFKLREFQKNLKPQNIDDMILKMIKKSTVLAFPKINIVRSYSMKNMLNRLGVNSIFEYGLSNLSLIPARQLLQRKVQNSQFVNNLRFSDRFNESPLYFTVERDRAPESQTIEKNIFNRSNRQTKIENEKMLWLQNLESQRQYESNFFPDLYINDIVQKVKLEINEQGTEAAAATLTYLRRSGPEVLFRADTPFIIVVRHDPTRLILFYGIINEPEQ